MSDAIVVLNAGSSSIKFSVFAMQDGNLELLLRGQTEGLYTLARFLAKDGSGAVVAEHSWDAGQPPGHDGALQHLLEYLRAELSTYRPLAVGHRVVHGGPDAIGPVRVTAQVLDHLEGFIPLFPLHLPHNLAPVRLLLELAPELPQVASFDTSFHRSNPEISQLYALPPEYAEAGVRRYGFHGLSYEYIARRLRELDPEAAGGRVVVAHLGSGASMCALNDGQSIASTMGFSAMDGLPMGTRPGNLDPGVVLHLIQENGMSPEALTDLFYKKSGLLGVSGISNDMRVLLESDDPHADVPLN